MGRADPKPLDGISVLIVDDNADSLALVEHILTYYGALPITASDGTEGLAHLRSMSVDVIVSDISMPGFSGYDFIQAVRAPPNESTRNIPAIALTAFDAPYTRAAASRVGFQAYMRKPFDAAELIREIVRLTTPDRPARAF